MRKLLIDFKKKIQESIYFYFFYIGSQKLGDKHVATITKWQETLENPNHKKSKRLVDNSSRNIFNQSDKENDNKKTSFDVIPLDCKIEIIRRLNNGLDLVNLSKCNRDLNNLMTNELKIWQNLCEFHFQQTNINNFVRNSLKKHPKYDRKGEINPEYDNNSQISNETINENINDWKSIYFKLKRRYGHREIYTDMIHKCLHCKSLFWKVIMFKKKIENYLIKLFQNLRKLAILV